MVSIITEQMWVAGIILLLTFLGIFTEQFHGIQRAKFAMAGAGAIIIAGQMMGFYSPDLAIAAIDWNVVFLLAIMMIIVSIMMTTGGFDHIAHNLAHIADGSQFRLMALLGSAVTIFSLLLDNVTTVIIFGPLIIVVCRSVQVSPIPYLMAAAMLSNTGGVATLVGDPPNIMIGSAANIDFVTFIQHMAPPVFLAWLGILVALRYLFRNELKDVPEELNKSIKYFRHKRLWQKSITVLIAMLVMFIFHHKVGWEPWLVAACALTILLFWTSKLDLEKVTDHIETPLLMFFISLFIVIGGVEQSGLLMHLGNWFRPLIEDNPLMAALLLLWVAALLSAMIDNIPFTAAMIPILLALQADGVNVSVLWWALAMGVGMGGNGSHIGSTANVYIVTLTERMARENYKPEMAITPGMWFKKGMPVMLVTLILCSLFIYFGFDYLYIAEV